MISKQPASKGDLGLDPLNIDAVEISRGPNSSIFGIGNSSGTVNSVPASALPLLFPGSKLHAKVGDGPNDVVVDWAAGAAG